MYSDYPHGDSNSLNVDINIGENGNGNGSNPGTMERESSSQSQHANSQQQQIDEWQGNGEDDGGRSYLQDGGRDLDDYSNAHAGAMLQRASSAPPVSDNVSGWAQGGGTAPGGIPQPAGSAVDPDYYYYYYAPHSLNPRQPRTAQQGYPQQRSSQQQQRGNEDGTLEPFPDILGGIGMPSEGMGGLTSYSQQGKGVGGYDASSAGLDQGSSRGGGYSQVSGGGYGQAANSYPQGAGWPSETDATLEAFKSLSLDQHDGRGVDEHGHQVQQEVVHDGSLVMYQHDGSVGGQDRNSYGGYHDDHSIRQGHHTQHRSHQPQHSHHSQHHPQQQHPDAYYVDPRDPRSAQLLDPRVPVASTRELALRNSQDQHHHRGGDVRRSGGGGMHDMSRMDPRLASDGGYYAPAVYIDPRIDPREAQQLQSYMALGYRMVNQQPPPASMYQQVALYNEGGGGRRRLQQDMGNRALAYYPAPDNGDGRTWGRDQDMYSRGGYMPMDSMSHYDRMPDDLMMRDDRGGGGRGKDRRRDKDRGRDDRNGRGSLLDDFRSSIGKGRKWDLQDLRGHTVQFCKDQHGSRFIQQQLEKATDAEKAMFFEEVLPFVHSLMTDVFGNYVIQKLFDHGGADQREALASFLVGHAVQLSLQMYGCRVVQKALEFSSIDTLIALVSEFSGQVMKCVQDQNGNHVIQKCIEVVSATAKAEGPYLHSHIQFIIDAFNGQVEKLSTHAYGCRVIQRILEHCIDSQRNPVLEEIRASFTGLIQDQYGNYVIQHVLKHGRSADRMMLMHEVKVNLLPYSQHKFASNVVEKCLQYGTREERGVLIHHLTHGHAEGQASLLQVMVCDPYANYVVQKIIDVADEEQREGIITEIRAHSTQLKRYTFGKHIISRLEKISGKKM